MKKMLLSMMAAVMTIVGMAGIATMSPVYAVGDQYINGTDSTEGIRPSGLPGSGVEGNGDSLMDIVKNIINVVIGVVGVIAVLMMIIGGISFITSQGDASKVTKARNTILYGVVGLVVALLAFAIVNFVLSGVFSTASVWL